MATTTGTIVVFDMWTKYIGDGCDMNSDTFKIGLMTSTATPSQGTWSVVGDITNETSGNGYARQTLTVTWSESGGITTWDFTDPVFTASGGSITARWYFVYDDTHASDPLVAYGLLDDTPGDVTATDGNTITFNVNASGFFTLSR